VVAEYTVLTIVAAGALVSAELVWLRTGLFRRPAFAVSMVVMLVGQVLVDGWLTKLSAPIVLYDADKTSGIRAPWDIPIEDFLFGFTLLTVVLLRWDRTATRAR
jgi:lycopene cyclase domain-containing protein